MCRCDAFLEAGSDSGRRVSVGGRRKQTHVWATLNTDNAKASDCAVCVSARVVGSRSATRDDRKSCFEVECPEQIDRDCCQIYIACRHDADNVLLPGGVTVKQALACWAWVRRLRDGKADDTEAGFESWLHSALENDPPPHVDAA